MDLHTHKRNDPSTVRNIGSTDRRGQHVVLALVARSQGLELEREALSEGGSFAVVHELALLNVSLVERVLCGFGLDGPAFPD